MTMRDGKTSRRTLLWWLAAALVAGIGAECGEGAGGGNGPKQPADPNVPPPPAKAPKDWPVAGHNFRGVAISTWVEPAHCPYTITGEGTDTATGQTIRLTENVDQAGWKIESGQHVINFTYESGHAVELHVRVQASKPGSVRGYITVKDGPRFSRSADFNGRAVADLQIRLTR